MLVNDPLYDPRERIDGNLHDSRSLSAERGRSRGEIELVSQFESQSRIYLAASVFDPLRPEARRTAAMAADKPQQWDDKEDEEDARGGGASSGQRLGSRELLFEGRMGRFGEMARATGPDIRQSIPGFEAHGSLFNVSFICAGYLVSQRLRDFQNWIKD